MRHRKAKRLAGRRVPQTGSVGTARCDFLAVRAESNDIDPAVMLHRHARRPARCRLPQPGRLVKAGRRQHGAIRAESHGALRQPRASSADPGAGLSPCPTIGQSPLRRRELLSVRADSCGAAGVYTADRQAERVPRRCIPKPGVVATHGGDRTAVRAEGAFEYAFIMFHCRASGFPVAAIHNRTVLFELVVAISARRD